VQQPQPQPEPSQTKPLPEQQLPEQQPEPEQLPGQAQAQAYGQHQQLTQQLQPASQATPPIEGRALTLEGIQRLTTEEATEALKARATIEAIAYLEAQPPGAPPPALALWPLAGLPPPPPADADGRPPPRDEPAAVAAVFAFVDADGDGVLSRAEVAALDRLLDRPPDGDRAWATHCAQAGADPAVGYTHAQYAASFVLPGAKGARTLHGQIAGARAEAQSHAQRDLARRLAAPYLSGRDFHRHVVKAKTHELMCRYVELPGVFESMDADGRPSLGAADAFVSWTWDTPWDLVLATLAPHTAAARAAGWPAPRYWFDIFAVNQHTALPPWACDTGLGAACPGCAAMRADMMGVDEIGHGSKGFERVVNSAACVETILIMEAWAAPRPLGRVWCLYEALLTVLAARRSLGSMRLTIGLPPAEAAALVAAVEGDCARVQRVLGAVDAEAAEATMAADKAAIFAAVARLLPRGFADLNAEVKGVLRTWAGAAAVGALAALPAAARPASGLLLAVAEYHRDEARYADAEPLFLEAVVGRRRVLGVEDPGALEALDGLGRLYSRMARHGEAEPLWVEGLAARRRVLGDDHPDTLVSITNLAALYYSTQRYGEAETLFVEARAAMRRVLGDDHPDTLTSMNNLAALYEATERMEEAEQLYVESLAAKRHVLRDDHPDTLASVNNLATLYYSTRRYGEAEVLFVESLVAKRRVLGDDHPDTLTSMNNLARLYEATERMEEAEQLYVESLAAKRYVLGDDHPDTFISMNNLAQLYTATGRRGEAESLYMESLAAKRRVLGDNHPSTLIAMYNLARLYEDPARPVEAAALFEEELCGRLVRGDMEEAVGSAKNLVRLLRRNGLPTAGVEAVCVVHGCPTGMSLAGAPGMPGMPPGMRPGLPPGMKPGLPLGMKPGMTPAASAGRPLQ
jgi:tetratricopeptide (TPR) repeat protein